MSPVLKQKAQGLTFVIISLMCTDCVCACVSVCVRANGFIGYSSVNANPLKECFLHSQQQEAEAAAAAAVEAKAKRGVAMGFALNMP